MKRMACAIALAAGTGLAGIATMPALANPSPATAATGLQVNVVPPGTVSNDGIIPLDVKFHGGNIRIIELYIDGSRITRQALSTRDGRGVVHFTLEPTLLTEGSHEVLIKAYEADGTCATTTTQIVVASADLNALARFEWPKRNAEIQGVVPIKIKIDPSIMDPYVTYTIDNDFLAFRNYAPFVYNWDTGKVPNGVHNIGIEVMDGHSLQVVQKMTITVNVKNVGGLTMIPPGASIKPPRADAGTVTDAIKNVAESALPSSVLPANDSVLGIARSSAPKPTAPALGLRANAPLRSSGRESHAAPTVLNSTFDLAEKAMQGMPLDHTVDVLRMAAAVIGAPSNTRPTINPSAHVAPGLAALAADPRELMPSSTIAGLAHLAPHFPHAGAIALRPSTSRSGAHAVATGQPAVRAAAAQPTLPRFSPTPRRKTFDVAFNNRMINFDVPPREENGIPLAPFRAIFENTGGTVKWNNDAKIVHAFDSQHDIEIKIGDKEATVNNTPLSMEAVPYIDHGRTIVPLSFVRDAMDVKITYDKETGHLLIEKK